MTRAASFSPDPSSELGALIRAGLGHAIDRERFAALAEMRERLQDQIDQLSDLLMERKIDPDRYLEELDRALMEASQTGIRILGVSDFHKVFGNQFIEYAVTGPKS
jgi:hypothetical protein